MENEMRDRLVESLRNADINCENTKYCDNCVGYGKGAECINYLIADHILADGWIRLPCKVGDTVYFADEYYHDSAEIDGINITKQGIGFTYVQYEYGPDITEVWDDGEFSIDEIGKTVFLTREAKEQAEQKLKELRGE